MALLCADVDSTTIKLLVRWNSDSMMKYHHQQIRGSSATSSSKSCSSKIVYLPIIVISYCCYYFSICWCYCSAGVVFGLRSLVFLDIGCV